LKVIRTIETFLPYICGPVNQAFQVSKGLKKLGIDSPVITTWSDVDPNLPANEVIDGVEVARFPTWFQLMRYCVSPGIWGAMQGADILHSHNYRNFQTDCAFFLPVAIKSPSS
jgi:hypothetical protein